VGLVHRQKVHFFLKKNPTSVVESYKTTYGDKTDITVVLMSVVSEEQKTFGVLPVEVGLFYHGDPSPSALHSIRRVSDR
jgi:hypothetical protein